MVQMKQYTFPLFFIVFPVAFISPTCFIVNDTFSFSFVEPKSTLIVISIAPVVDPFAMLKTILPHSFVFVAIGEEHFARAMFLSFFEEADINISIAISIFSLPRFLIVWEISFILVSIHIAKLSFTNFIFLKNSFEGISDLIYKFSSSWKHSFTETAFISHKIILV